MNMIIASSVFLLLGVSLVAVRLFQEGHFYAAALLISAIGAIGLFIAIGMRIKDETIFLRGQED